MKTQWEICERFPERRFEIIDCLAVDGDFRSLCRDYGDCLAALERFRLLAESSPDRVTEYERLRAELEDDIQRVLNRKNRN